MANINELGDGGPDGSRLGKTASEKVSFWGVTPVVQAATVANATNTTTTTSTTTAITTDLDSVRTKLNSVLTALRNAGILAQS